MTIDELGFQKVCDILCELEEVTPNDVRYALGSYEAARPAVQGDAADRVGIAIFDELLRQIKHTVPNPTVTHNGLRYDSRLVGKVAIAALQHPAATQAEMPEHEAVEIMREAGLQSRINENLEPLIATSTYRAAFRALQQHATITRKPL